MGKNKAFIRKDSPYQWFQGGNGPKPKMSIHKAIWRVSRILIYIILLSISLAGCVQSMVIKTDTKTGSGLEFYSRVADVSPHMTTYKLTTKYGGSVLGVDTDKNYWLNNPEILKNVHTYVESLGGTFGGTSSSSGARAWMSRNEGIRFENGVGQSDIQLGVNGNPFVVSTTQNKYDPIYDSQTVKTATILVPTIAWKDALVSPVSMYLLKNWKIETVTYDPTKLVTNNPTKDQLQSNFTYDSFFQMMYYMGQNQIAIDSTQAGFGDDKSTDSMNDKNKAFLDSYLTVASSTNWYADKEDKGGQIDFKQQKTTGAILDWSSVQPIRAIVTWADSWHLGPFYAFFVFPLSKLTIAMVGSFPAMAGWSSVLTIFLLVLVLRTFAYALTFKSTLQQVKQQEVQAKIAQINAKYEPYKGNKQMESRKKQETFAIYKKEGISPIGALGSVFLTMPIFLSMWRVIGTIPYLKSTSVAGVVFAATSYQRLLTGEFQYLVVMALSASLQVVSILLPRWLMMRRDKRRSNIHQQKALKKQNKTQTIIAVVYAVFAVILPAGVSIYMIFSALYTIGQNSLNHKIIKWQNIRRKRAKGIIV